MKRLKACCCMFIDDPTYIPPAVLDHFPMNVPDNKEFYNQHMQGHFRFTTVRDPVDQFVSNFYDLKRNMVREPIRLFFEPPGFCLENSKWLLLLKCLQRTKATRKVSLEIKEVLHIEKSLKQNSRRYTRSITLRIRNGHRYA